MFETTSEEESDTENGRGADQVVDVEDLGKMMGHMKSQVRRILPLIQRPFCLLVYPLTYNYSATIQSYNSVE